jgi:GT2 family glycosyltransferase
MTAERTAPDAEQAAEGAEGAAVVSVVVVSYRCAGPLVDCLDSLALQRGIELEVIVVENASGDGTAELIRDRYPWVRLIENAENVGFARAVNEALEVSAGDPVLLVNPDTVLPPDAVAECVAQLALHPEVGMLGCKLVRADGTLDHACKRGFPTVASAFYHAVGLSRAFPRSRRFAQYTAGSLDEDESGYVDAINGAFMLVRRAAIDDVGFLDEQFWLGGEDLDWCWQFAEHGWRILYWPGVTVTHLKGASAGGRRTWRDHYVFYRSVWLFYRKHLAPRHHPVVRAAVFAGIVARFAVAAVWSTAPRPGGARSGESTPVGR